MSLVWNDAAMYLCSILIYYDRAWCVISEKMYSFCPWKNCSLYASDSTEGKQWNEMFEYTNCSVEHSMKLNWGAKRKKIIFFLLLNVIKVCYNLFLLDYHAAAVGKATLNFVASWCKCEMQMFFFLVTCQGELFTWIIGSEQSFAMHFIVIFFC